MISIKQIRHALAIEEHLHFNKAAEACSISQSALSNSLNEMERQLGFQIFERNNKQVLVTPLGAQVLKKAREIYLSVLDLQKMAQAKQSALDTQLSIGIIPTIAPYLLPKVLPALKSDYPELELTIVEDQSHILVDSVLKGHLDTAILALPYDCQGLLTFTFWQEDLYWVTHRDDELASHKVIHSEDIKQSNLMLLKDGHCLKDHALAACQFSENDSIQLGGTSLTTLVELVVGKMGTTLVPEIALESLVVNHPQLSFVRLDEPGPHREFAFLVRPQYPSLDAIECLSDYMKARLES